MTVAVAKSICIMFLLMQKVELVTVLSFRAVFHIMEPLETMPETKTTLLIHSPKLTRRHVS